MILESVPLRGTLPIWRNFVCYTNCINRCKVISPLLINWIFVVGCCFGTKMLFSQIQIENKIRSNTLVLKFPEI